jgi:UDP-N-acetylmuramate--alanine ligase
MDFYKSMHDLKSYFIEFINKVPSFGKSFICIDDKVNSEIIKFVKNKNFFTYGQKENSNFKIKNIRQYKSFSTFDLLVKLPNKKNENIRDIRVPLLGIHNIQNTVGAIGIALTVGIPIQKIKKGLKNFKGVQRRFNKIFSYNNIDFYDDYAHHPTEIKVVLQGVKKVFGKYEKVCIFQPHRISRLKDLRKEFASAFKDADTVILCPIFTAGEKIKLGFSYQDFSKQIIKESKVKLFVIENKNQLAKYLKQSMYGKKIVVGMGAGSISNWIKELPSLMK